jgi:glycosyltransferase involved in cell wall biosynthesis
MVILKRRGDLESKILFLLPYPLHKAPSQRFRVECYFELLKQRGIGFDYQCFLDENAWNILYKKGAGLKKASTIVKGYFRRVKMLFQCKGYQYIFIHREAAPLGPPLFEWVLAKLLKKKLIFDFDDATWIPNVSRSNQLARYVKCFWKVSFICKWSYKVSAGNAYLLRWALQHQPTVVLNPTCVDTVNRYNRTKEQELVPVTIGWTGSHSTLRYLSLISGVLKELEEEYPIEILVICDQEPSFALRSLRFIPWREASEIDDLLRFSIGVMPLEQDAWSEGKCGFKLIQYLALGIPAVASPVGVNKEIIEKDVNGYLCSSAEEWKFSLRKLIEDQSLRSVMGEKGRAKVSQQYSVQGNTSNFLCLFS